jgi:prepilin signal peptidase PulO-like enzyme (type II secretory pathway)
VVLEIAVAAVSGLVVWWATVSPHAVSPWLLHAGVDEAVARAIAAAVVLSLAYLLVVSSFIDLEHTIIPDEITKPFQAAAPWLALGTGVGLSHHQVFDPSEWLIRFDTFRNAVMTPAYFSTIFVSSVAFVLAGLLASLPLARWVYSSFCPPEQRWGEADHRGFRIGVLWFVAVTVPPSLGVLALVYFQPGGPHGWWLACAAQGANAVLGSLLGWLSLYVVGLIGTMAFRRNAMGFGDVKFLAPIGAFLGPIGVLYAFFGAAIVGTVVGLPMRLLHKQREIPFGPWLAVGALIALLYGPELHRLFLGRMLGH